MMNKIKWYYIAIAAAVIIIILIVIIIIVRNNSCYSISVESTNPQNNGLNIDVSQDIYVTFSRAVNKNWFNILLSPSFSYSAKWQKNILTIIPQNNLAYNTAYNVFIKNNSGSSCKPLNGIFNLFFKTVSQPSTTSFSSLPVTSTSPINVPTTGTPSQTLFTTPSSGPVSSEPYQKYVDSIINSQYPGDRLLDSGKLPVSTYYYDLGYDPSANEFTATINNNGSCQNSVQMVKNFLSQNGIDPSKVNILWFPKIGGGLSQDCMDYINSLNQ